MLATLILSKSKSSQWHCETALPFSKCIHHDDMEAIDPSRLCISTSSTNYIIIYKTRINSIVYACDKAGKILSLEPIMKISNEKPGVNMDDKVVVHHLFPTNNIVYTEKECDFDNWYPNEII